MKRNVPLLAGFILVSLLLMSCGRSQEESADEANVTGAVPVEVIQVERGTVRRVLSYTGEIEAWEELDVVPSVSGKIARIYVKEGDHVTENQVLAELDTDPLTLALEQATANLHAVEAAFNDAEKNWNRMKELVKDGSISSQQFEKAELGYNASKAQVEQAGAAVDLAEYNLRVSVMRAPYDGVITRKDMNEGDTINPMMPGGGGVVTVMDFSQVKVMVLAPDTDLRYLKSGLPVFAKVDVYPEEIFEGTVYVVNPAAVRQSRLFEIQLAIPNPGLLLKPGMFARVDVVVEEKNDVTTLPLLCLVSPDTEPYVFVVSGGKAEHRSVTSGIIEGELAEIVTGLDVGETVVSVGMNMIEGGTPVEVRGGAEQ